jgi:hypothetical protein
VKKVSDLSAKLPTCRFCGKSPPCPDWTCKRLKVVVEDSEGWQVEFVDEVEITFTPEGDPTE